MIDRNTYMRMGAEARLREIQAELDDIWRMFPELRNSPRTLATGGARPAVKRRRRRMTAAQRKAVSGWMRRYWAKRRAAKGAAGKRER
jgi:hypothetical protein